MRPFGLEEAREERDTHIVSPDDRLQKAWLQYRKRIDREDDDFLSLYHYAKRILRFRPSLMALHHHVLMTPYTNDPFVFFGRSRDMVESSHLGIFVSAGYQLLPEREIIYDLETPELNYIGAFLKDKHLIITGTVGDNVGLDMMGHLTNTGITGMAAGYRMIGQFINRGRIGTNSGYAMFGCFTNTWRGASDLACGILGSHNNSWNISKKYRAAFLRDIENPRKLSYDNLSSMLKDTYPRDDEVGR
jgi:hypothetical protein